MNDLIKRIEIKASVMEMGEKIAWGSDTSLMREAAQELKKLHKDKLRIDWLSDRDNLIGNVQLPTECVVENIHDMRAAIDSAMAIGEQQTKTVEPKCDLNKPLEEPNY